MHLFLDTVFKETGLVFRSIGRSKGPAFVVVLTLSLGIASLVSIFSFVDALFLRPLGVSRPFELVKIAGFSPDGEEVMLPSTVLDHLVESRFFSGVCGLVTQELTIEFNGVSRASPTQALSGDCFAVLGVKATVGRLIAPQDDFQGGERVAVLTFASWQKEFNGNRNIVGQAVRIEGIPFTIIGVAEHKFDGLLLGFPPAVFIPAKQAPLQGIGLSLVGDRGFYSCWIIARRGNASFDETGIRLRTMWPHLLEVSVPPAYSGQDRDHFLATAASIGNVGNGMDYVLRDRFRKPLGILLMISSLILLVCCVNTAGLFLLRNLSRRKDIAVRLALGASRSRVMIPLALEAIVLGLFAVLIAVPLAFVAAKPFLPLVDMLYENLSVSPGPDLRILAFGFVISVTAAILSGSVPTLMARDLELADTLRSSGRALTGSHPTVRRALIVLQLALTLAIMVTAGVFIQTVKDLKKTILGVDSGSIIEFDLNPIAGGYRGLQPQSYYRNLIERVRSISGVRQAALSHSPPFPSFRDIEPVVVEDGRNETQAITADIFYTTDTFFETFSVQLVQGEAFSRSSHDTRRCAVVTTALARRLSAEGPSLGRHLRIGNAPELRDIEICGIVRNSSFVDIHVPDSPTIFLDYWHYPEMELWPTLSVRVTGGVDPARLVTETVQTAGHEYPVNIRTLTEQRDKQLFQERLLARLSTIFGVIGLVLAIVGVYGLLSFNVSSRAREIGIRIAMGAQTREVTWFIVREGLWMAILGAIVGLPLAIGLLIIAAHFLDGIRIFVPRAFGASFTSLLILAVLAALAPCVRAAKIDPAMTLRDQ